MSYESAPATRLVATKCACCGRPLVDATSVEIGMGPVCRARAGLDQMIRKVDDPDRPDEGTAAPFTIGIPEIDAKIVEAIGEKNFRRVANLLVFVAAAKQHDPKAVLAAWQILRLGYEKLARVILEHVAQVEISVEDSGLRVRAPYNPSFPIARKTVPGRSFLDAETDPKTWIFREDTTSSRGALLQVLRRTYPRDAILTPSRVILPDGTAVLKDGSIRHAA